MPDPDFERLPFLDAEPWRVVVINPTGRYARNQVAGLIAAGTPLVAGVALGRGGETMDGTAALRPRRRSARAAERGGALHPGRRRARRHRRMRRRAHPHHRGGRRICAGARRARRRRAAARAAGSLADRPEHARDVRAGARPARLDRAELLQGGPARGDRAQRHAHARHGAATDAGRHRPEHGRPYRRRHRDRAQSARISRRARARSAPPRRCSIAARSAATRNMPWPRRCAAFPSRWWRWWSAAMRRRRSAWAMPARSSAARARARGQACRARRGGMPGGRGTGAGGRDADRAWITGR